MLDLPTRDHRIVVSLKRILGDLQLATHLSATNERVLSKLSFDLSLGIETKELLMKRISNNGVRISRSLYVVYLFVLVEFFPFAKVMAFDRLL